MGHMITDIISGDDQAMVVAGIDAIGGSYASYPVYADTASCAEEADAVIDFSNAAAVDGLLGYCLERHLPLVLCTTGLSAEQISRVEAASAEIPILRSANMSIGVNLLFSLLKEAAGQLVSRGFDVEIVEKHHSRKLDAPSGTAIALADCVNEGCGGTLEYVYDRTGRRMPRPKSELGISAVRGGTIVGDHDVIFAGEDEVITFSHRAYSRAVFAKGAVEAAKFLAGRAPGLYQMGDVLHG